MTISDPNEPVFQPGDMSREPDAFQSNPAEADARPGRLPTSTLLLGAGGLLILIGAFLPWVTVFGFGISGVNTNYGIITILIGIAALIIAFGAGRLYNARLSGTLMKVAAGLGALACALALYVGFAIREDVAEDEGSGDTASSEEEDLGEFGDALEGFAEALKPKTGVGVYTTLLGGALAVAGGVMASRGRSTSGSTA